MRPVRITLFSLVVSLASSGQTLQWAKNMGGPASENANAIAVDLSGNVYTTGYFQNISDFDPGPGTFTLAEMGSNDVFISKLDVAGNFVWAKRIGSYNEENAKGIALDASGNVYVT